MERIYSQRKRQQWRKKDKWGSIWYKQVNDIFSIKIKKRIEGSLHPGARTGLWSGELLLIKDRQQTDHVIILANPNTNPRHTHTHTHNRLTAVGPGLPGLAGTRRNSPTHTHPDHRTSFINFLHLLRSIASSVFSFRAWLSSLTTSLQVLFGLPRGLPQIHDVGKKIIKKVKGQTIQKSEWKQTGTGRWMGMDDWIYYLPCYQFQLPNCTYKFHQQSVSSVLDF